MDQLKWAYVFSKIDLKSRYQHIRVKEDDIPKVTLRSGYEHYEYLVMSIDVTNGLHEYDL